jgi:hypothetical protein
MPDNTDKLAAGSAAAEPKRTTRRTNKQNARTDYEVGYKKPPKATRFQKGQSGNPKGSKKVRRIEDLRTLIEDVLFEPVEVRDGSRVRTMTQLEVIMQAHGRNALKGDPKAVRTLAKLAQKAGMFSRAQPEGNLVFTDPGGEAGKILDMFHAEQAGNGDPDQG